MKLRRLGLSEKIRQSPFWIEPSILEPSKISYQLFIELESNPIKVHQWEDAFGEFCKIPERYMTTASLCSLVNVSPECFLIEEPLGPNHGWVTISSLVKYYDLEIAKIKTQKTWDDSFIIQQFKLGKISRARYGYKESETGYTEFLGGCENPDRPFSYFHNRQEFMERLALRESIVQSLNVDDFRDFLGIEKSVITDEKLLEGLHESRATSLHQPPHLRKESKVWLIERGLL